MACGMARPAAPRRVVTVARGWGPLAKHTPNRLFVFGLGYTGLGAASYFQERGWSVAGTCRTPEKCQRLAQRGITTFHFDPNEWDNLSGKALEALRHATHVLSTVPPDAENDVDPVIMAHAQQLSEHAEHFRWVGYISSTSVYGDYEGEWVDEGSELRAAGGKGWSRVMAEHEWLALHDNFGLPVHIFRCGGIYGPERSAIQTVQRAWEGGQARPSAARRSRQRFTARCHVYDICQTLEASMRHARPGAAYNVADDDPADRATVMAFAAELLERRTAGLPPPDAGWGMPTRPPLAAAAAGAMQGGGPQQDQEGSSSSLQDLVSPISSINTSSASDSSDSYDSADDSLLAPNSAAAAAFAAERPLSRRLRVQPRLRGRGGAAVAASVVRQLEEKRVSNALIKKELGVRLAFPTYREGLAAIAAGDGRPFELE